MRTLFGSIVITCCLSSGIFAADVGIEQMAPKDTFVVVSMKNFDQSMTRLKRTKLWGMWTSEPMQEAYNEIFKMIDENVHDTLEELGVSKDTLLPPQGNVGMVMFMEMDEELGTPRPHMLLTADYGANADATAKIIDAAIKKGEKESQWRYEIKEVRGRKVLNFELPEPPADEMEEDIDEFGAMPPNPFQGATDWKTLSYVRDGNRFMFSSSMTAVEDALEVIDGEKMECVGDREDYRNALAQLGGEKDMCAMLLTKPLEPMLEPLWMLMGGADQALTTAFGHIDSLGVGVGLDGSIGMMEETVAVHTSGEKGELFKLLDTETARSAPPIMVGPNAVSYFQMNFELSGLFEALSKIVASLPEGQREMADMQLQQLKPDLEPALATLGPEINMISTIERPISETSKDFLVTIRCSKTDVVSNLLAQYAPMAQLQPRDFLGQTIYSMDFGPSIGLGGGYLVIGDSEAVEQALRAVGSKDTPSLGDDATFQYAARSLPQSNMLGWGFVNTMADYEYSRATASELFQELDMMAMQAGNDVNTDKFAAIMKKLMDDMPPELLAEFIGPNAMELHSTDNGIVFKSYQLGPVQ